MITEFIFWAFASLMVVAATMVVFARNPVHNALFLVLTFVAASGLWILLNAEFLALILIIVYVGAVMTLFLFVIMMAKLDINALKVNLKRYLPVSLFVITMVVGLMWYALGAGQSGNALISAEQATVATSNIRAIGAVLYTDYVYPFEIAAVLLLLAIIAAISLVLRGPQQRRDQVAADQIFINRRERVRMVRLKARTSEDDH